MAKKIITRPCMVKTLLYMAGETIPCWPAKRRFPMKGTGVPG